MGDDDDYLFLMHAIPGGPFTTARKLPPAVLQNIEVRYKLNDPLLTQYKDYAVNVLHGDMGPSFKYPGRSVNDIIREGFPVSLQLGLESLALALIFGIPAGLAAALKRNQWQDRVINCFATLGMAVPSFVVAALLIDVFALRLGILPAAMWSSWKSQILPAVALAGGPLSIIARLTRSSMLDVLEQDYIKTARAKGLSEVCVLWKHALPNSLIPISAAHWFGTDHLGRDLFIRVLYGARISLFIGFVVSILNCCIGVVYGGIAGYFGGMTDRIMMNIVDVLYGVPSLLIPIVAGSRLSVMSALLYRKERLWALWASQAVARV